jgi:xanthine dehydrogenase small subunit
VPKRAAAAEAALVGVAWAEASVRRAMAAREADFTPLTDMRAAAGYRRAAAKNMRLRYWHGDNGVAARVLEVSP